MMSRIPYVRDISSPITPEYRPEPRSVARSPVRCKVKLPLLDWVGNRRAHESGYLHMLPVECPRLGIPPHLLTHIRADRRVDHGH
jgi:hypothetical protein